MNRAVFQEAKERENNREWALAEQMYRTISKGSDKLAVQASRRRAECLMRLQRWSEARAEVDAVLKSGAPEVNRDIKRLLAVLSYEQNTGAATEAIDDFAARWLINEPNLRQKEGRIILTAAAPKTGSTSLATALAAAAGYRKTNFLCYQQVSMARGIASLPALQRLKGVGIVNHCHLAPDAGMMADLRDMPWVQIAVHFRHPADVVLSTVDMIIRQGAPIILIAAPHLVGAGPAAVMKWALENYLPELLQWIQDWLAYVDANHPSIMGVSTLEQMKTIGQDALAKQLLDTAGIPYSADSNTVPQRTGNRMSGGQKIRYTAAQRDYLQRQIPPELLRRFGWG